MPHDDGDDGDRFGVCHDLHSISMATSRTIHLFLSKASDILYMLSPVLRPPSCHGRIPARAVGFFSAQAALWAAYFCIDWPKKDKLALISKARCSN